MDQRQRLRLMSPVFLAFLAMLGPTTSLQAQAVRELVGHKDAVAAASFSPDGKQVVTGSFDKSIKLWDLESLKEIKTFDGHTDMVLSVLFGPDGTKLLSGSQDQTAKLWELTPPKELRSLPAAPAPLRALIQSPSGAVLASAADDGVIRLFEAATGNPIRDLTGHTGPVLAGTFSADSARLYTTGSDRTMRVWEVGTGNQLAVLEVGTQPATAIGVLPKEEAAFTGDATGQVRRWNLPVSPIRSLAGHGAAITKVKTHPNGTQLLSIGADNTIHLHDLASGGELKVITAAAPVTDIAVSPADPNLLVSVGADNAIRLWNLADGQQVAAREGLAESPTAVAFLPNGQGILVGQTNGDLRLHAYPFQADVAVRPVLAHDAVIKAFESTTDGSLLLTASDDKQVRLWNADGTPLRAFAMFAPVHFATVAPNKQFVAAADANHEVRVWNVNGQELKVLPNRTGPLAFSPDGQWFAASGLDNKLYLYPTSFAAEGKPVTTHALPIRSAIFSPQSNLVLSGGGDKIVKVADVASGMEAKSLAGHEAGVAALDIRADGKQLITGGDDNKVIVWDLDAGTAVATYTESGGPVYAVAISPDGAKIASGSKDNHVRIYEGGNLRSAIPIPDPIGVAFAADNSTVVTGGADQHLRFITANPPRQVGKHEGKIHAVAVSADGATTLSAGEDKQVRVLETATGKPVRAMAHEGPVTSLALSADASKVVSGSADKTCRVWNLTDGKQLAALPATNVVTAVAISPDGSKLAYSSTDNIARVHGIGGAELQTFSVGALSGVTIGGDNTTIVTASGDKVLRAAPLAGAWAQAHGGPVTSLAVSADGGKVASGSMDNTIAVRNPADGAVIKSIGAPAPASLAFAADNVRLVAGGGDKVLRLFDSNAGTAVQEYPPMPEAITSVAIAPDAKSLASVDSKGTISLWSTPAENKPGLLLAIFERPAPAISAAFLADNKTVAAASGDKIVRFFELPPPPVVNLAGHKGQIYGVAFSPDGKMAATAAADNSIILWDLATGTAAKTLAGHTAQVYSVAFSPDGKQLVSGSGDKNVTLWDIAEGKAIKSFAGAQDAVYQVAFVSGGTHVLAGGVDKLLHLWEVASGSEVRTFAGAPDEIYGMSISPSGKRLATSGYGGSLVIWDFESAKPLHQQNLSFGAFSVAYHPGGAQVVVGNNDGKAYIVDIPEAAR